MRTVLLSAGMRTLPVGLPRALAQHVEHSLEGGFIFAVLRVVLAQAAIQTALRLRARVPVAVVQFAEGTAHGLLSTVLQGHDQVWGGNHHMNQEGRFHIADRLWIAGRPCATCVCVARLLAELAAMIMKHNHLHQRVLEVLWSNQLEDQLLLIKATLATTLCTPLAILSRTAFPWPTADAFLEHNGFLHDLLSRLTFLMIQKAL
mmetsp:Transcript_16130/g.44364  ORF Transcript_16130/g.44364 Transcript_16130/m.44364 type:complete len:204 (+) Transcript_16130:429-1040(+)